MYCIIKGQREHDWGDGVPQKQVVVVVVPAKITQDTKIPVEAYFAMYTYVVLNPHQQGATYQGYKKCMTHMERRSQHNDVSVSTQLEPQHSFVCFVDVRLPFVSIFPGICS